MSTSLRYFDTALDNELRAYLTSRKTGARPSGSRKTGRSEAVGLCGLKRHEHAGGRRSNAWCGDFRHSIERPPCFKRD
jgi:hypothetical protein